MSLSRRVMVEVVKVHNSTMLVARVLATNSLMRFRFMHPLDVKVVVPGYIITILKCQFSNVTKMINCLSVQQDVFRAQRRVSFTET
jgi:hypothetical protein